jgi:hypothetical protein
VLDLSCLLGVLLEILVSKDGVEHPELAEDTRDRRLSLRLVAPPPTMSTPSSSSRSDPSVSHNIGVLEFELPDTVLAIESFLRWFDSGVIRRLNRGSFELLLALLLPPAPFIDD